MEVQVTSVNVLCTRTNQNASKAAKPKVATNAEETPRTVTAPLVAVAEAADLVAVEDPPGFEVADEAAAAGRVEVSTAEVATAETDAVPSSTRK